MAAQNVFSVCGEGGDPSVNLTLSPRNWEDWRKGLGRGRGGRGGQKERGGWGEGQVEEQAVEEEGVLGRTR